MILHDYRAAILPITVQGGVGGEQVRSGCAAVRRVPGSLVREVVGSAVREVGGPAVW